MKKTNTKTFATAALIMAFALMTLGPLTASANNGNGGDHDIRAKAEAKIAKIEAKVDAKMAKEANNDRGAGHGNNWKRLFTWGWIKKHHENHGTSTATSTPNAAPRISDINIVRATSTATISFKTNEQTTAELRFSTSNVAVASSTSVLTDASLSMNHSFSLAGLNPDTQYFYVIIVKDAQGLIKQSGVNSFKTKAVAAVDATAPLILFSGTVELKPTSANVIWTTNEPTNGRLWIGTSSPVAATGTPTKTDASMAFFHNLHVGNLSSNTQYFYSVSSTDKAGNVSATVTGSFKTPSM